MKKLLILIGAAVLLFGCTGPMGPQGASRSAGRRFADVHPDIQTGLRRLGEDTDAAGNFIGWWHEIQMPELSTYVYEYGMYNVYLWDGNIQVPLPLIVYNETDNALWEKKISCDFAVGSVAVYYQENDFMNEGYRPEDMTFRIHLVW